MGTNRQGSEGTPQFTRRDFLKGLGVAGMGGAAVGLVGGSLLDSLAKPQPVEQSEQPVTPTLLGRKKAEFEKAQQDLFSSLAIRAEKYRLEQITREEFIKGNLRELVTFAIRNAKKGVFLVEEGISPFLIEALQIGQKDGPIIISLAKEMEKETIEGLACANIWTEKDRSGITYTSFYLGGNTELTIPIGLTSLGEEVFPFSITTRYYPKSEKYP